MEYKNINKESVVTEKIYLYHSQKEYVKHDTILYYSELGLPHNTGEILLNVAHDFSIYLQSNLQVTEW